MVDGKVNTNLRGSEHAWLALASSFCGHTSPLPRALLLVNANVEVYPSNVHLQVILFFKVRIKLLWTFLQ